MNEIQYRYAVNPNGVLTDIDDLPPRGNAVPAFKCPECQGVLDPRRGDERAWHFRHKGDRACSHPAYLRRVGKELFRAEYLKCLEDGKSFSISNAVKVRCSGEHKCEIRTETSEPIDITRWFKSAQYLELADEHLPDLILEATNGRRLYVEINPTASRLRNKTDAGFSVIMLQVERERELDCIKSHVLVEGGVVTTFNFKNANKTTDWCTSHACPRKPPEPRLQPRSIPSAGFAVERSGRLASAPPSSTQQRQTILDRLRELAAAGVIGPEPTIPSEDRNCSDCAFHRGQGQVLSCGVMGNWTTVHELTAFACKGYRTNLLK